MYRSKQDVDRHVSSILGRIKDDKERSSRGYHIAKLYFDAREYETAKRYLIGFLTVRDNFARAHKLMGQILEGTSQHAKAVESYKRCLSLDDKQDDVLLKICAIYSMINVDPDKAKYWAEKAEKLFPGNEVVFRLKEKSVGGRSDVARSNFKEMETLVTAELIKHPTDVDLRIRLLKLYVTHNRVSEAYEHAVGADQTLAYIDSLPWYEYLHTLYETYEKDQASTPRVAYHMQKLLCLVNLLRLQQREKEVIACVQTLHKLDLSLFEAVKVSDKKPLWSAFLSEIQGEFFHLASILLLKRANKSQIQWRDAVAMSSACCLVGQQFSPIDIYAEWFVKADSSQQKLLDYLYRSSCFRISHTGHMLHHMCQGDRLLWAVDIKQRHCTSAGRERLFDTLFTLRDMRAMRAKSYLLNRMNFIEFEPCMPTSSQLLETDSVAQLLRADDLHTLIWLSLQRYSLKDQTQPNYCLQIFETLQYTTSSLEYATPESLCRLDIEAFFYAAVRCSTLLLAEAKERFPRDSSQPDILPLQLCKPLCTNEQKEWWKAAYKLYTNTAREQLSKLRLVLQRGLEAVRLIGSHGMAVTLIVHLAKTFHERACEMEAEPESAAATSIAALQRRAEHYWTEALNQLKRMQNNQSARLPRERLFIDDTAQHMLANRVTELINDGNFFLASLAMKRENYPAALQGFESLTSPYASYHTGELYKLMAMVEVNGKSHTDLTDDVLIQHQALLIKARDALYLTLDRLQGDKNHKLSQTLSSDLDDIETRIARAQSKEGIFEDSHDGRGLLSEDDDEATAEEYQSPLASVHMSSMVNGHLNGMAGLPQSTPCLPSVHKDINSTSLFGFHVPETSSRIRPSLERLEAQIRSLALSQESILKTVMTRNDELASMNKELLAELRASRNFTKQYSDLLTKYQQGSMMFPPTPSCAVTQQPQPGIPAHLASPMAMHHHPAAGIPPAAPPYLMGAPLHAAPRMPAGYQATITSAAAAAAAYSQQAAMWPNTPPGPPAQSFGMLPMGSPGQSVMRYGPTRVSSKHNMPQTEYVNGSPFYGYMPIPQQTDGINEQETEDDDAYYIDGEYFEGQVEGEPIYLADSELVQEWPYGNKTGMEGKSTITYQPPGKPIIPPALPQSGSDAIGQGIPYGMEGPLPVQSLTMPGPGYFSSGRTQSPSYPSSTSVETLGSGGLSGHATPTTSLGTKGVTSLNSVGISTALTDSLKSVSDIQWQRSTLPVVTASSVSPVVTTQGTSSANVISMTLDAKKQLFGGTSSPQAASTLLGLLAAKHNATTDPASNLKLNNIGQKAEPKSVLGGFTFSGQPTVCSPLVEPNKKDQSPQVTPPKAKPAESQAKPFAGFSFSLGQQQAEPKPAITPQSSILGRLLSENNFDANTIPGFASLAAKDNNTGIGFNLTPDSLMMTSNDSPASRSRNKSVDEDRVEEYEPNVDFTPVVQLPDVVDIKTGEEDEDQLFLGQARLYRFDPDTKQWKERGRGEMKILKHKSNGSVRILMRRDQVLKLCANHYLSADMKLSKMPNTKNAWCWNAMDYADGDMKQELFAVKFKGESEADEFKAVFEQSVEVLKQSPKKDKQKPRSPTKLQPDSKVETIGADSGKQNLGQMFKQKEGSWECAGCYINNNSSVLQCPACGTKKPGSVTDDSEPATNTGQPSTVATMTTAKGSGKQNLGQMFKQKEGSWECAGCYINNSSSVVQCPACGTKKPGAVPDHSQTASKTASNAGQASTLISTSAAEGSLASLFQKKEGTWECPGCLLNHSGSILKCPACMTLKPGVKPEDLPKEAAPSSGVFGGSSSTSGFSFAGLASTQQSSGSGFTFKTADVPPKSGGFVFGEISSSSTAATPITTTSTEATSGFVFKTPATTKSSSFTFGTSTNVVSSSASVFGGTVPAQTPASVFGGSASAQASIGGKGSVFDGSHSAQAPISGKGSMFGGSPAAQSSGGGSGSIFGGSPSAQSSVGGSGFVFGSSSTAQAPVGGSASVFGGSASAETPIVGSASVFGGSAVAPASTTDKAEQIFGVVSCTPKTGFPDVSSKSDEKSGESKDAVATGSSAGTTSATGMKNIFGFGPTNPTSEFSFTPQQNIDTATTSVSATSTSTFTFKPAGAAFTFGSSDTCATETKGENVSISTGFNFKPTGTTTPTTTPFKFAPSVVAASPDTKQVGVQPASVFGTPTLATFSFSGIASTSTPVDRAASIASPRSPDVDEHGHYVTKEGDDSHIYFEPLVKLEKIDMKTGEEDESTLFQHRAKLYRFDSSEWKERGLGDVKILQHNETKKIRLLMRREQILKICLNHYITEELELKAMPKCSGKAWIWHATDHTESEPRHEQFSIRFKTETIAENFRTAFDNARNLSATNVTISSPEATGQASEDTEVDPGSPVDLSTRDVKGPGSTSSTSRNLFGVIEKTEQISQDDNEVVIVYVAKPTEAQVNKAQQFMLPNNFYLGQRKTACSGCLGCVDGDVDELRKLLEKKGTPPDIAQQYLLAKQLAAPQKPAVVTVPHRVPANVAEDGDKGDAFGGFFSGASLANFSFSALAAATDTTPDKPKAADPGKPFSFSGAGQQLFGTSPGQDTTDKGEDGDVVQSNDIHFEPIVQLPENVEVKTGEEDEDVVWSHRSKVFRFDKDANQWKERGIGDLKILKHKFNGRYRLLLRREQVLKLACNHMITPDIQLKPLMSSETAWCWVAQDYTDGEGKMEQLAAKFKNVDLAQKFKEKFEECQLETQNMEAVVSEVEEAEAVVSLTKLATGLSVTEEEAIVSSTNFYTGDLGNVYYTEELNALAGASEQASPGVQGSLVTSTEDFDKDAAGNVDDEDEEGYEDYDDEDDDDEDDDESIYTVFEKRATLFYHQSGELQPVGMGTLLIQYDDDVCGYRIQMSTDVIGKVICNHIISQDSMLLCDPKTYHCDWSAVDFSTDEPVKRIFRVQFSSRPAAEEFTKEFEQGRKMAIDSDISEHMSFATEMIVPEVAKPSATNLSAGQGLPTMQQTALVTCSPAISAALHEIVAQKAFWQNLGGGEGPFVEK